MSDQNGNNPWFAATMGLAGLIVGYAIANGMNGLPVGNMVAPTAPSAPTAQVPTPDVPAPTNDTPATVDDDPVLGDENAAITLIEFTDYQCPFCSRHYTQTHNQIKAEYIDTGKVKLVTRDFPLGFHQNAQKAAEAAECADDQGDYYGMHDKLFIAQQAWSNLPDPIDTFVGYGQELGLNEGELRDCLTNGTHAAEVTKDMSDGQASGIDGTPGFWILGPDGQSQKISGAYPFDTFKTAFDSMLN